MFSISMDMGTTIRFFWQKKPEEAAELDEKLEEKNPEEGAELEEKKQQNLKRRRSST